MDREHPVEHVVLFAEHAGAMLGKGSKPLLPLLQGMPCTQSSFHVNDNREL